MQSRQEGSGQRELERLEELEARVRELEEELAYRERLAYEERHGARKDERLAAGRGEAGLDETARESFPASDAPAQAGSGSEHDARAQRKAQNAELDDALDDTFPASDPPSIVAPKGEEE